MATLNYNVATDTMTSQEKRLRKFLNNPDSLKYSEVENLLLHFGFQKVEAKGSHAKFKRPNLRGISIPIHNHDCKSVYKKYVAKILKTLRDPE